jgi:hypothetical protein
MYIDPVARTGGTGSKTIQVRFHGAASDPNIVGAADIDWDLTVVIDAADPAHPKASVTGTRDKYPSYEVDVKDSNGSGIQPYFWMYLSSASVFDLYSSEPIGPVTPVEVP